MTDRELMQMALDALDWKLTTLLKKSWENHHIHEVVKALRDRLAQPEPEPVAWLAYKDGFQEAYITSNPLGYTDEYKTLPLWAHPPEWVGLTDEERVFIASKAKITEPNDAPIKFGQPSRKCIQDLFDAIEAKLKEKNT